MKSFRITCLLLMTLSACGADDQSIAETEASLIKKPGPLGNPGSVIAKPILDMINVGVVPIDDNTCPGGVEPIKIRLDTDDRTIFVVGIDIDDTPDTSSDSFWDSPTAPWRYRNAHHGGVTLTFCKVAVFRHAFKALTIDAKAIQHEYALLKLDTSCPPGSTEVMRYFDTEDDPPHNNWTTGDISPNAVTKFGASLSFCVFQSDLDTMAEFPDLGVSYAVMSGAAYLPGRAPPAWVKQKRRIISMFEETGGPDDRGSSACHAPDLASYAALGRFLGCCDLPPPRALPTTFFNFAQVR